MTEFVVLDDSLRASAASPTCWYCAHKFPTFKRTCKAFPNGIPDEIWQGHNPHTDPYPGDLGIRFERRKPKQETNE